MNISAFTKNAQTMISRDIEVILVGSVLKISRRCVRCASAMGSYVFLLNKQRILQTLVLGRDLKYSLAHLLFFSAAFCS